MDDEEFLATQPVLPSLLRDVVAYVEVRSGHDNRSRGVISELRNLGAGIATSLSKDVTHVVFQGGYVSTYRKARKMCNVVAVSWIEASKELGCKAPEEEHPPPGFEKYEDPDAARKIKVLKSMQPNFDNEKDDEQLNAILEKIKKKRTKMLASTNDEMCSTTGKQRKKRKSPCLDKKNNEPNSNKHSTSLTNITGKNAGKSKRRAAASDLELTNPPENGVSSKRKSSGKKVKLFSRCGDLAHVGSSETITVENGHIDFKNTAQKQSISDEKKKNGTKLALQKNSETSPDTSQAPFEFAVPKPVKIQKCSNTSPAGQRKTIVPLSEDRVFPRIEEKSKTESTVPSELSSLNDKSKYPSSSSISNCTESRPVQTRPLVFIENLQRGKDHTTSNKKKIDEPSELVVPARKTRRSSGLAGPLIQVQTNNGNKESQSDMNATNPFVAKVLEALSSKKQPRVVLKSPWRRQGPAAVERRQSPRLHARQKENHCALSSAVGDDSDGTSPKVNIVQKTPAVPRFKVGLMSASAHMLKIWKKTPSKISSPETALLDISFGPAVISQRSDEKKRDTDSDVRSVCSQTGISARLNPVEQTPNRENLTTSKPLPEILDFELTEGDRSGSPILGTRTKRRSSKSLLSSSCTSTQAPFDATSLSVISSKSVPTVTEGVTCSKSVSTETRGMASFKSNLTETRVLNCADFATTAHISKETKKPEVKEKNKQVAILDRCTLPSSAGNGLKTEERSSNDSFETSVRSSRRSASDRVGKPPTLVCTHLKGSDVKRVMQAVSKLGKLKFEEQVSERTTHLVASGPRRTINMLRAICRGCWIVRDDWVHKSMKAQKWLPEDDFELTEFSPMVQQRRLLRQSSNGSSQWNLLSSVGPIFVNQVCQPPPSDLKDLIHLTGGSVAKSVEKAAVVISPIANLSSKRNSGKPHVEPTWLLDCIVRGEKLPFSSPKQ